MAAVAAANMRDRDTVDVTIDEPLFTSPKKECTLLRSAIRPHYLFTPTSASATLLLAA